MKRANGGEVKFKKVTVTLPPEMYRELGHWAVDNDLDLSGAALAAIKRMLVGVDVDRTLARARKSDAKSKRKIT